MQRPIMNPRFVDDGHGHVQARRWYHYFKPAWRGICLAGGLLMADIFGRRHKLQIDVGTRMGRIVRGICYRMLFIPLAMVVVASALVYTGTHPAIASSASDPTGQGMNYDPVEFTGDGGAKLQAWVVPILDAKHVLAEKDKTLAEHRPAIILVHDFGSTQQQMLPLVRPLHDAGYVVMLTTLRGSSGAVGSTFGLNEASDVKAAVDLLSRAPFIDARKIGVIGIGTGANAALLAAQREATIGALVLDKPCQNFSETFHEHIGPQQGWMRWVNPLCEWAFNVAYGVNASELNLQQSFHTIQGRGAPLPMLVYDSESPTCLKPSKAKAIIDFLDAGLGVKHDGAQSAETSGKSAF